MTRDPCGNCFCRAIVVLSAALSLAAAQASEGQRLKEIPFRGLEGKAVPDIVHGGEFTRDGKLLLVSAEEIGDASLLSRGPSTYWIAVYDVTRREELFRFDNVSAPFVLWPGAARLAAVRPARTRVPPEEPSDIVLLNLLDQEELLLRGHGGLVGTLSLSPDAGTLLSYALRYERNARPVEGVYIVHTELRVWDLASREAKLSKTWKASEADKVAFTAAEKSLLKELSPGNAKEKRWTSRSKQTYGDLVTPDGQKYLSGIGAHVPSREQTLAQRLTAAATMQIGVWIHDAKTQVKLQRIRVAHPRHVGQVWGMALSPDGTTLALGMGDYEAIGTRDWGEVWLMDLATCETLTVMKNPMRVLGVSFSPDGKYLAAGTWDGKLQVWEIPPEYRKPDLPVEAPSPRPRAMQDSP